jgi:hypothetical protein
VQKHLHPEDANILGVLSQQKKDKVADKSSG